MADTKTPLQKVEERKHLNDGIDLSGFNYKQLQGDKWKEYLDLVEGKIINPDARYSERVRGGGLNGTVKRVFEVYKVKPVLKRLNPDADNSPLVVSGITLEKDDPLRSTITFLHQAILLNSQIHSRQTSGQNGAATYEYYLLQKPASK